jgi:hypothetical protein
LKNEIVKSREEVQAVRNELKNEIFKSREEVHAVQNEIIKSHEEAAKNTNQIADRTVQILSGGIYLESCLFFILVFKLIIYNSLPRTCRIINGDCGVDLYIINILSINIYLLYR